MYSKCQEIPGKIINYYFYSNVTSKNFDQYLPYEYSNRPVRAIETSSNLFVGTLPTHNSVHFTMVRVNNQCTSNPITFRIQVALERSEKAAEPPKKAPVFKARF